MTKFNFASPDPWVVTRPNGPNEQEETIYNIGDHITLEDWNGYFDEELDSPEICKGTIIAFLGIMHEHTIIATTILSLRPSRDSVPLPTPILLAFPPQNPKLKSFPPPIPWAEALSLYRILPPPGVVGYTESEQGVMS